MIEGQEFTELVQRYFFFLRADFGFEAPGEDVRGSVFYEVTYKHAVRNVSISYENIEDYLLVIVYLLHHGNVPDYDDNSRTLHLPELSKLMVRKVDQNERLMNDRHFSDFSASSPLEQKLLKAAKELRLCLTYFDRIVPTA